MTIFSNLMMLPSHLWQALFILYIRLTRRLTHSPVTGRHLAALDVEPAAFSAPCGAATSNAQRSTAMTQAMQSRSRVLGPSDVTYDFITSVEGESTVRIARKHRSTPAQR